MYTSSTRDQAPVGPDSVSLLQDWVDINYSDPDSIAIYFTGSWGACLHHPQLGRSSFPKMHCIHPPDSMYINLCVYNMSTLPDVQYKVLAYEDCIQKVYGSFIGVYL